MIKILIGALLFSVPLWAEFSADWKILQPPEGSEWRVTWGQEPLVRLSETRGEKVLNGLWAFQPTRDNPMPDEEAPWGLIQVPGSWRKSWSQPRLITQSDQGVWEGYDLGHSTWRAWYRRPLEIPKSWQGRRVLLDLDRVSTDAEIFVDGQLAGEVHWPGGTVDLTEWVEAGKTHELRVRVLAVERNEMVSTLMGTEEGHNQMVRQRLSTYGIIGDVVLRSEPMAHAVQGFRFRSRVGEQAFDLSWQGSPERVRVELDFLNAEGELEKRFSRKLRQAEGLHQTSWTWKTPRLWDVGQPELYQLRLRVYDGKTLLDEFQQRVAFREIEIRGKDIYLNGSLLRLRPNSANVFYKGIEELNEGLLDGLIATGHNFLHYWPNDPLKRGTVTDYEQVASLADEKGILISLPLPAFYDLVKSETPDTEKVKTWKETVSWMMERMGHHPSVVVWGCSPNFYGHGDDQNPRRIGRNTEVPSLDWTRRAERAERWISWIKEQDPTRQVLIHQGASVGDIYATNTYLCLLPLQEREEWLSHWAEHGEKPFMGVEFGPPLDATFTRGRNNGGNAGASEPLLVEHAVSYLGPQGYQQESAAYRKKLAELQAMGSRPVDWHGNAFLNDEELYQEVLGLFLRNTGRSWRSWGLSAGVVHWGIGRSLFPNDWRGGNYDGWSRVAKPAFKAGRRGQYFWRSGLPLAFTQFWRESEALKPRPAVSDFLAINAETLAYIGGGLEQHWVDKTHHYLSGARLEKQVMLINDRREDADFEGKVLVELGGTLLLEQKVEVSLRASEIRGIPIALSLPESTQRQEGIIHLELQQGERMLKDSFSFRVYPQTERASLSKPLWLFDPDGATGSWLEAQGQQVQPLKSELPEQGIVILGRNSLEQLPWDWSRLSEWVQQGGRLLIMGQSPELLERETDFRPSRYVSRRFWPVASRVDHPILRGLDGEDFRDWPGAGTLRALEEHTGFTRQVRTTPLYGWRWGTRGSVASSAVELPHHSAWSPLLQGEFDLSYSPLMTLELGRGHVLFCGLDLEERGAENPVGNELSQRMLHWLDQVEDAQLSRKARITASPAFAARLQGMGLLQGEDASLWVIGPGAKVKESELDAFLQSGGHVLRMNRPGKRASWSGTSQLPDWPELQGLRLGDLRPRLDIEVGLLDGQVLARRELGSGVELSFQLHPELMEGQAYLQYSRWNSTRAMARLLANLGAGFARDQGLLSKEADPYQPVELPLVWKHAIEKQIPTVASLDNVPLDEGNRKLEEGWHRPDFDDSTWLKAPVLGGWERNHESLESFDGAMWLRGVVAIPPEWKGKGDVVLEMPKVDDFDITYVNGFRVGMTGPETDNAWNQPRAYTVRSFMLRPGKANHIAVRIFDHFGGGGFTGNEASLYRLRLKKAPLRPGLYHQEYRRDRALGDSPFRYYRW